MGKKSKYIEQRYFNQFTRKIENFKHLYRSRLEDGLVGRYEEHEDSVYAVEWSSADPWTFASLSYDGRLVLNKVPRKYKYQLLL